MNNRSLKEWSVWKTVFQRAFKNLVNKKPLLLAGATAFFAVFSAAPILLILIQVVGVLFGQHATKAQVSEKLANNVGDDTRDQISHTLSVLSEKVNSPWAIVIGILVLVFLSTNIFRIVKTSFNMLWMVKLSRKPSFAAGLRTRLLYVALIIAAGFQFAAGLVGEVAKNLISQEVLDALPFYLAVFFRGVLGYLFSIVISAAWLAILFRYLPDVRPAWRTVFAGALFSAILFALGRAILYITLVKSNMSTLYGASASVVVVLLFVFYSSLILYYGAAVTVAWSETFRQKVQRLPDAEFYTIHEEPGQNIAS